MNKTEFNERVNELWALTKAGNLPRNERFQAVEQLTDEYIASTGERPDSQALDRLATLCLYEEMTDKNEHKMMQQDRPIMSDRQQERRHNNEASEKLTREYAVDGRCHALPTRHRPK